MKYTVRPIGAVIQRLHGMLLSNVLNSIYLGQANGLEGSQNQVRAVFIHCQENTPLLTVVIWENNDL